MPIPAGADRKAASTPQVTAQASTTRVTARRTSTPEVTHG